MEINWSYYDFFLKNELLSPAPLHVAPPFGWQIKIDSRQIVPGDWFFTIKGQTFDGHTFIEQAIEKGCAGVVCEKLPQNYSSFSIPLLQVRSSVVQALGSMAFGWRHHPSQKAKICALTGSVGKTTTKEMLKVILEKKGKTLATEGNLNNEIGVPLTLLKLTPEHEYAVIEMGARKPFDIQNLTKFCDPDLVACLHIGMAHIEIFGSQELLARTKLEILSTCPNATWVINGDDSRMRNFVHMTDHPFFSFSRKSLQGDLNLIDVTWTKQGTMVLDFSSGKSLEISCAHSAYPDNALGAAAMALALGLSFDDVALGLKDFHGVKRRFEYKKKDGLMIIDDTYNASPQSMAMGIETLERCFADKEKILVIGDMRELGDETQREHKNLGTLCAKLKPNKLYCVGDFSKDIAHQAKETYQNLDVVWVPHVEALLNESFLENLPKEGVLYAKASRGVRLDRLVDYITC